MEELKIQILPEDRDSRHVEIAQEKRRHMASMEHEANHLERYIQRHHDKQYGLYNYNYYGM